MRADAMTERAILGRLKAFSDNFMIRDIDGMLSLFALEADVVMLGSEDWEMAAGHKNLRPLFKRLFSRKETTWWVWKLHSVSATGPVAWVLATGEAHARAGKSETVPPYRLSAVFEKRGYGWLWMQFHGSEPFPAKE